MDTETQLKLSWIPNPMIQLKKQQFDKKSFFHPLEMSACKFELLVQHTQVWNETRHHFCSLSAYE